MTQSLDIFTVDAFTGEPFKGNPAAICPLTFESTINDDVLQKIAMEMNLSETAYPKLLAPGDSFENSNKFGLRWFTPSTEVDLCGHATLATAAVIFQKYGNQSERVTFQTRSGDLIVGRQGDYLKMDFPTGFTEKQDPAKFQDLIKSLDNIPGVKEIAFCPKLRYLLIQLEDGWSRKEFENWSFNIPALPSSTNMKLVLLIATVQGIRDKGYSDKNGEHYDFLSRCFAPWSGIDEDPVTGSAQTVLAHYWHNKLNKTEFYTRQASQRGGDIRIKYGGDRVEILGRAKVMMEAKLYI